jgi:hypothetical protein
MTASDPGCAWPFCVGTGTLVGVPARRSTNASRRNVTALTGTVAAQLRGCPSRAVPIARTG